MFSLKFLRTQKGPVYLDKSVSSRTEAHCMYKTGLRETDRDWRAHRHVHQILALATNLTSVPSSHQSISQCVHSLATPYTIISEGQHCFKHILIAVLHSVLHLNGGMEQLHSRTKDNCTWTSRTLRRRVQLEHRLDRVSRPDNMAPCPLEIWKSTTSPPCLALIYISISFPCFKPDNT